MALLRSRGIDAHAELASTGSAAAASGRHGGGGVSASGGCEETVAALRRHRGTSLVVGVTNRPNSAWRRHADVCLPLLAGDEEGGIACSSYRLHAGGAAARGGGADGGRLRAGRPRPAQSLIDAPRASGCRRSPSWSRVAPACGFRRPAERFGSAQQSALMLREAPRIVADACETGDWLHVDVYLTKRPGYALLLLPGSRFDGERDGMATAARASPVVSVGRALEASRWRYRSPMRRIM